MESFKAKVGPLPVYAWGILVAGGVVAVMWWRSRSSTGGASDQVDPTGQYDGSATAQQLAALGYLGYGDFPGAGSGQTGQGTDTGAGGSTGGNTGTGTGTGSTGNPSKAPGNCRMAKDPSGQWRHICGFGHWFRKVGGSHWYWTPGPIPSKGIHNTRQYRPGPPLSGRGIIPTTASSGQQRPLTGAVATGRAVG